MASPVRDFQRIVCVCHFNSFLGLFLRQELCLASWEALGAHVLAESVFVEHGEELVLCVPSWVEAIFVDFRDGLAF